jgi:vacuolar-type H+-ATPase subunit H
MKQYNNLSKHEVVLQYIAELSHSRYFISKADKNNNEFLSMQYGNILEEASEILKRIDSKYERIDGLCDMIVFSISALTHIEDTLDYNKDYNACCPVERVGNFLSYMFIASYNNNHLLDLKDILTELSLTCINLIEIEGYNSVECLKECLKEISSREQDPDQKINGRKPGEKWLKDKNQDKSTLYKANYERCRY